MLTQIHIQNLVTIQELHLDFHHGTSVITGETGAGKSILIDAIELALGARATANVIRDGQEKVDISLCFDVTRLPEARAWLKNLDLDNDSAECIIRRTINREGRSRSFINGMPTPLQPLRELSQHLLSIHGQNEHHLLLKNDEQRKLLDRYAGHHQLLEKVHTLAKEWHMLAEKISELRALANEGKSKEAFLKFQLQELEELNLSLNEFAELDLEHKQLSHSGELLQNLNHAIDDLAENESSNVIQLLNKVLHALQSVQHVHPKIPEWLESINSAIIAVQDTENELRHYLDTVDLDPNRLEWLEQRITALFTLARKHKINPNELFDFQQKLQQELATLENSDEHIQQLEIQQKQIEKNYQTLATELSNSRKAAAKKLEKEITTTIRKLAMPHADLNVYFEPESILSANGLEKVSFHIKTNVGHTSQSLAKIASGGELSRVSLAIQMTTAKKHPIPTLIFDEVDVGIGGGTAEVVGKLIRELGESHQVLCITHAPQVAAQGHQHFRVEKITQQDSTLTHIKSLTQTERVQELARMLGGVEITETTLAHAKEMIESVTVIPAKAH